MIRALTAAILLGAIALPAAIAQDDHGHGEHVFAAHGIEIVHPWARAAATIMLSQ